ncbi:MAG: hypothetical protein HDR83_03470 [Bacteroides sp.]|nr:hypothetical protein [Bacteroidales bacterium]MBD5249662.1 hypothetical protein [Barnesiella sp.]MBD5252830.1 hypothetical protein [Barnesiella sp.]MBD5368308.1 hypothetical protein [Bacteroides sp.]
MKQRNLIIALAVFITFLIVCVVSCNGSGSQTDGSGTDSVTATPHKINKDNLPINLSVFIDLSDRIVRPNPTQVELDTAIVNQLIDFFIENSFKGGKLLSCKNKFNVFFYPAPTDASVTTLAKGLNIDLSILQGAQKKERLAEMKETFDNNLAQIYSLAIKNKKFIGCDIWGFFTDKKVDNLCMSPGYRNILVILTDGYLYHIHNKKQDGNAYSYLNPQNLMLPGTSLIVGRDGLEDLEVLMLEVNPSQISQLHTMEDIIETWMKGMGVEHYMVAGTDLPSNTAKYISNFLK